MLERHGNSVIFYAHFAKDGDAVTGLTVSIDIYEVTRTGVMTQPVSSGVCIEIGSGLYRYLLSAASVDAQAEYIAVFHTDGDVDYADPPALWSISRAGIDNLDDAVSISPTGGETADAVWDEPLDLHLLAGSAGEALNEASEPNVQVCVTAEVRPVHEIDNEVYTAEIEAVAVLLHELVVEVAAVHVITDEVEPLYGIICEVEICSSI